MNFLLFTAMSLFEANWFATGNKCFLGQIFRTAQGKTTIQIQSCSELLGHDDEVKQNFKVLKKIKRKFGNVKLNKIN